MPSLELPTKAERRRSRPPVVFKLPQEIVDQIAETRLSHDDWKSLRLTSHFFNRSMIRLLFRRVYLSKTKLDRESFISISRSPHLATAARELVWYELAEDEEVFEHIESSDQRVIEHIESSNQRITVWLKNSKFPLKNLRDETPDGAFEIPPFTTLARDAFWRHGTESTPHSLSYSDLPSWFQAALDAMPNIHTFVSCRMPPLHVVSNKDYLLTAQLLQQGSSTLGPMNSGFYRFLLPAMHSPKSTVKKLIMGDDVTVSSVFGSHISDGSAFQKLTHIHLCLDNPLEGSLGAINMCLRSATALQELRICASQPTECHSAAVARLFAVESEGTAVFWPHLRRLELHDTLLRQKRKANIVLRLLEAHSRTLRHLVFRQCEITGRVLVHMSRIRKLKLDSLQIIDDTVAAVHAVPDAVLLGFVNNKTCPGPYKVRRSRSIIYSTSARDAGMSVYDKRYKPKCTSDVFREEVSSLCEHLDRGTQESTSPTPSTAKNEKYVKMKLCRESLSRVAVKGTEMTKTHPTTFWLFTHPDGRRAIGREPLEFFSDWEDSDGPESDDAERGD